MLSRGEKGETLEEGGEMGRKEEKQGAGRRTGVRRKGRGRERGQGGKENTLKMSLTVIDCNCQSLTVIDCH